MFFWQIILRSFIAVMIGVLIGSERARHGRAAGIRTHILVCLGAALTSMISLYVSDVMRHGGDVLRISAQVISGIGFLGAGMIILKNNNVITGLTTAAGVWTTSVIGIAVGFGFYSGALVVTAFFLITIILFARLERGRKSVLVIYLELEDMYRANETLSTLRTQVPTHFSYHVTAPKSTFTGHLGLTLIIDQRPTDFDPLSLLSLENVVFVEQET